MLPWDVLYNSAVEFNSLFYLSFVDGRWQPVGKTLSQIDTGIAETPWGVDPDDNVYSLQNGKMRKISGKLIHVSSGESGVWGVNRGNYIYFRRGVTERRPSGSSWRRIGGRLKQIDSGPFGMVCGVNRGNQIYCRRGITLSRPMGVNWINVPGRLMYISCGLYGHWGVNKAWNIYFRYGVKQNRPQGTKWKRVPGKLVQIESGPNGAVYGVNGDGVLYTRRGISKRNPIGGSWKRVGRTPLASISVGLGVLYAIDRSGKPVSGDVRKFLGPKGLPKKPGMFYNFFLSLCIVIVNFFQNDPELFLACANAF